MMGNGSAEYVEKVDLSNNIIIENNFDLNYNVYQNIHTEFINITTDKLEIILRDYCYAVEKKRGYETPLSLVVTLCLTLCTATFHDTFYIPASLWQAFFIIVSFLCIILPVKSLVALIKYRKVTTITSIISKIKNEQTYVNSRYPDSNNCQNGNKVKN